ncbi:uncharacterized protein LOC134249355 [Saccostrea cucullata]|uniref:uncharacterized protein LOC134249355 n=1 Tax=Saccostrea cuccullata TaxID=36930 RepID=UPI002ED0BD1E
MKRLSLKRKLGPTNEEKPSVETALKSSNLSCNNRVDDIKNKANDRSKENVQSLPEKNLQPLPITTKLSPFPPFIPNKKLEDNVTKKKPIGELTPFPPMCRLCRKRKPQSHGILEKCLTANTKNERKNSIPETSDLQDDQGRSLIQEAQQEPVPSASTVSQCPMCGKAFDPRYVSLKTAVLYEYS